MRQRGGKSEESRGREYRKFVEHRAAIFKGIMRSAVGSDRVMDAESRLKLRVDERKDYWRGLYVWQRIYS